LLRVPAMTASQANERDELREVARLELPADRLRLLDAVIDELDERGLLPDGTPPLPPGYGEDDLDLVLQVLRAIEGPGLGTRSVREHLAAQATLALAEGRISPLAARLACEELEALAGGQMPELAARLQVHEEAVLDAAAQVRAQLVPPLVRFGSGGAARLAPPDLLVHADQDGRLRVTTLGAAEYGISVDAHAAASSTPHERAAAAALVGQLDARAQLLRRLGELLIEVQSAFLLGDNAAHRPLTRSAAAHHVGVHPSTVARMVRGKLLRLPDGSVVPLAAAFGTNRGVIEQLRLLLDRHPLATDGELVALLAEEGTRVARRTVAKYRSTLGYRARAASPPR
ncbi:MAG: hypothetical protein AB7W59_18625, partial [Acidimicrobiia bacterium]